MTVGRITWKIFPPNLCERKKTYRKTRARLLIKLIVKLGRNFSSKRTEKLERDFKTRWQEKPRRDHWDASAYPLVTSMVGVSLMQWGEVPAFCWVGDWPGPRALLCIKRAPSVLQGEGRQVLCGSSWVSVLLWFVLLQDRRRLLSRLWRHVSGNRTCHQRYILNVLFRQKEIKTLELTWNILFLLIWFSILYKKQLKRSEFPVPCSVDKFGVKADFHFI